MAARLLSGQFVRVAMVGAAAVAFATAGCANVDTPTTQVVIDNDYPNDPGRTPVVYEAKWQAVVFPDPIAPGSSSAAQASVPCSPNTAWVVLAPGWDPQSSTPPTALVVLRSKTDFQLPLDHTLHIPVDDEHFVGRCGVSAPLSQSEADFITQRVFPDTFASLRYDAATCSVVVVGDGATP